LSGDAEIYFLYFFFWKEFSLYIMMLKILIDLFIFAVKGFLICRKY